MKGRFCEELERIYDQFPKYHMNILLDDFSAKVGKIIFKPTNGNESLQKTANDKGVRVLNFSTSINLIFKRTMFPHKNIHICSWSTPD
jgi:hypothetical protein